MTTPSIEQVTLPGIPWQTTINAIKVAFGNDAANWEIKMVEAEEAMPDHLSITSAPNNPNAKGKVKPTFMVFPAHIPQPSGTLRLVYHVWAPRNGIQGNQVVDLAHSLIAVVSHYCDVAETIALHWRAMEIDIALRAEFDEPDLSDPAGYDVGDSAFDSVITAEVGDGIATEDNGDQGNGEGDDFSDYDAF